MKILLTGGGTAGHVYPALSVVEALREASSASLDLLYVGSVGGMERGIVERTGIKYAEIAAAGLRGKSPVALARGLVQLAVGLTQALRIVGQHQPWAVLATGGYVCVPVVIASWLRRVPVLIYLPDVEPGLAIKFLSRFATRIAVTLEDSRRFFNPRKVVATGYPVRSEVRALDRREARERLSLPDDARVLLVVGGSRGARSINEAVAVSLPRLLELAHVVHVCGQVDEAGARSRQGSLGAELATRYHLYPYLHSDQMAAALVAADLVVARAGASSLGEFPAAGLPSVLIPYPYAGAHQRLNASALGRLGAGVELDDSAVRSGQLLPVVEALLTAPERLHAMSSAARALDRPNAAHSIAAELVALTRRDSSGGAALTAPEEARQ